MIIEAPFKVVKLAAIRLWLQRERTDTHMVKRCVQTIHITFGCLAGDERVKVNRDETFAELVVFWSSHDDACLSFGHA